MSPASQHPEIHVNYQDLLKKFLVRISYHLGTQASYTCRRELGEIIKKDWTVTKMSREATSAIGTVLGHSYHPTIYQLIASSSYFEKCASDYR